MFVKITVCPLNTSFLVNSAFFKTFGILSVIARYRHFRDFASLHSTTLNILIKFTCTAFSSYVQILSENFTIIAQVE